MFESFRRSFGCAALRPSDRGPPVAGGGSGARPRVCGDPIVTVVVTCAVEGFDWGTTAWCLDIMGFLGGAVFFLICRDASNKNVVENRGNLRWILVWSSMTVGARILDTLMLFGVVKISKIYTTPDGAVLASNIVSEVIIGNLYVLCAVVGSVKCLFFQGKDGEHAILETIEYDSMP